MLRLLITLTLFGISFQSSGCYCLYYKHFIKTCKVSEYAVLGRLTELTEIDSIKFPNRKIALAGKFEIEQVLKGELNESEIEIKGGYGGDCLINLCELELNKDYVILLGKDYGLSICGYTILPVDRGTVTGKITKKKEQTMQLIQLIKKIQKQ
jgi:hypothetical protein